MSNPAIPLGLTAWLILTGCATTQLDAQWVDPQFARGSLAGVKVLIVCDAAELTVKHVCQERMAAEVKALGAIAVPGPDTGGPSPNTYLSAARVADARALLVAKVAPGTRVVGGGTSVGFGFGGFGWGGGGTAVSTGVGVSMPVGGPQVSTAYSADTSITDVASGKLIWTGKASTPAQNNLAAQLGELSRVTLEGAKQAGLF